MSQSAHRPAQLPLGFVTSSRATFAGYLSATNAEAVTAVQTLVATRQGALYLSGPAGSGKTHLLQAACREARETGARALYLPLADFVEQSPELLEGLGAVNLLAVDDLEAIAQNRAWQVALVPLLDAVRARQGALLFAARHAYEALPLELRDLQARIGWAAPYHLTTLDDAGLALLIRRRAAERGLELSPEVASYILQRVPRNAALLMMALEQLDKASLAEKRRLTVPLVREVLRLG